MHGSDSYLIHVTLIDGENLSEGHWESLGRYYFRRRLCIRFPLSERSGHLAKLCEEYGILYEVFRALQSGEAMGSINSPEYSWLQPIYEAHGMNYMQAGSLISDCDMVFGGQHLPVSHVAAVTTKRGERVDGWLPMAMARAKTPLVDTSVHMLPLYQEIEKFLL